MKSVFLNLCATRLRQVRQLMNWEISRKLLECVRRLRRAANPKEFPKHLLICRQILVQQIIIAFTSNFWMQSKCAANNYPLMKEKSSFSTIIWGQLVDLVTFKQLSWRFDENLPNGSLRNPFTDWDILVHSLRMEHLEAHCQDGTSLIQSTIFIQQQTSETQRNFFPFNIQRSSFELETLNEIKLYRWADLQWKIIISH